MTIAHLYPAEMNIYGDNGNVIALRKRLEWRGYQVQVVDIEPGVPFDFSTADIVFGGGGQDSGQLRIAADLRERASRIAEAVLDGVPLLAVGGLYQLLGEGFITETGREIPGIRIFHALTRGSITRMIGNVVAQTPFGDLVGFENHSGETTLAVGQAPLGHVHKGYGNNRHRRSEGAISHNAIGTYLHGPILPKNPVLTDHLILTALRRRNLADELAPLDDHLEQAAGAVAARLPQ